MRYNPGVSRRLRRRRLILSINLNLITLSVYLFISDLANKSALELQLKDNSYFLDITSPRSLIAIRQRRLGRA